MKINYLKNDKKISHLKNFSETQRYLYQFRVRIFLILNGFMFSLGIIGIIHQLVVSQFFHDPGSFLFIAISLFTFVIYYKTRKIQISAAVLIIPIYLFILTIPYFFSRFNLESATFLRLFFIVLVFNYLLILLTSILISPYFTLGLTITSLIFYIPYLKLHSQQTSWFFNVTLVSVGFMIILSFSFILYHFVFTLFNRLEDHNQNLKKKVNERTKQLETLQEEMVRMAHQAGMVEVAGNILHNVGNILNNVNTSASLIEETINQSAVNKFRKANDLIRDHQDHLQDFLQNDPRGKELIEYYLLLENYLTEEQQTILENTQRLKDKIHIINETISTQRQYGRGPDLIEEINIIELIEQTLILENNHLKKRNISIAKDYQSHSSINGQRAKLFYIIINIIQNAQEALIASGQQVKEIQIKTWQKNSYFFLKISDNGVGIKEEHLKKIFKFKFSTKSGHNGFGLHNCANYLAEMKIDIDVQSEGENKGASFQLIFPLDNQNDSR
ncbi:MAG: ATP-binding protein [Spirochaetes bacterium]|nr:ATP-binding protein [Spirochaetota bacterium]